MKEYISQELKVSDSNPSTLLRFLIYILPLLGKKIENTLASRNIKFTDYKGEFQLISPICNQSQLILHQQL